MTTEDVAAEGFVKPGYEGVRDAFVANFAAGRELGASTAVTVDGEVVVDLWGGDADRNGRAWTRDTIVNVYSTTKTMASLCVLMAADRGLIDLDAPVADYWPEFAQNGKAGVLVRHVMSHTAGVPGYDPPLTLADAYDWDKVCANLAAQAPWWEPGTASGYHAGSQGYLQGELIRRTDGRTLGRFFREEVAEPLGADFHIGFGPELDDRVAEMIPPEPPPSPAGSILPSDSVPARMAAGGPDVRGHEANTRAWRAAEIPASNGHGNARSIARVHAALACGGGLDGVRLLSERMVERILDKQIEGTDLVLGGPISFGMGYAIAGAASVMPPRAFFWGGWGGSFALIDLDARMSVAYAMNRMTVGLSGDSRAGAISAAAYAALEAR